MSKIGNYVVWLEEKGYDVDDENADAVYKYMQTQQYREEHDEQERMRMEALYDEEKERRAGFFNLEVATPKLKWGEVIYLGDDEV